MYRSYHETLRPIGNLGIKVSMATLESPNIPLHWHDELEILFCLNGTVSIQIDDKHFELKPRKLIVFDSNTMHSIRSSELYMFLCIHIDKRQLMNYLPDIEYFRINCHPDISDPELRIKYLDLCQQVLELTKINIELAKTDNMRSDGMILLLLSDLLMYFSTHDMTETLTKNINITDTLREIISYTNEHYMERLSATNMSEHVGFSKEYFCRYFKQHTGITFTQYLNEVRISHAGRMILHDNAPISDVMTKCGFTNQTMFNRAFKEIYKMTPREARKTSTIRQNE